MIRAPRPHWLAIPETFCRALYFAHTVADRIHVLDYGRTIAEGAPESVLKDPNVLGAYLGVEA